MDEFAGSAFDFITTIGQYLQPKPANTIGS